jgi:hypothetical protein
VDDADRELLTEIRDLLAKLLVTWEEYKPMLERYKAASEAGSFLKARKALKNG